MIKIVIHDEEDLELFAEFIELLTVGLHQELRQDILSDPALERC